MRSLADHKGQDLVNGVLSLVRRYRPVHISLVGGEPLVRFRELDVLLPRLSEMGIAIHLVTSAVREIPRHWAHIKGLIVIVSIDGLQPDHDVRRKLATYERILKNTEGYPFTVHCTVTRQMMARPGYFEDFISFWSARAEVRKIWFSLFTPQVDAETEEILSHAERAQVLATLASLRAGFPKLKLPNAVVEGYRKPPRSPAECIFARTTLNITADLQSRITPCQFGGNPDCSQCGWLASAGLKAVSDYRVMGFVPVGALYNASDAIGKATARVRGKGR